MVGKADGMNMKGNGGRLKSRITLLAGIAAMCALLAVGTLSYTMVTDTAEIRVVTGGVDVELSQTGTDRHSGADGFSEGPADAIELKPGESADQTAVITNTGAHPVYVRVQLALSVEGANLPTDGILSLDGTDGAWVAQGGFLYYDDELKAGASTGPLFTKVMLAGGTPSDSYQGKTVTLEIKALSVQSENNGTNPFAAAGWPTR